MAVPMDITKEQEVVDAVAKAIDAFGRIDILVNNSGIAGPTAYVWDLKLDDWNEIIAVDLTGACSVARALLHAKLWFRARPDSLCNMNLWLRPRRPTPGSRWGA